MLGPVMERRRIEIRAIGPNQCTNLWINANLVEQRQLPQRAKQLAPENGPEVDHLLGFVVKGHAERIGRHDANVANTVNRMTRNSLLQGRDRQRGLTTLQALQQRTLCGLAPRGLFARDDWDTILRWTKNGS